jgi:hypothetical protein
LSADLTTTPRLAGGRIGQAVGFVEREMPWEGLRAASAGAWQMRPESVRAEQDVHTSASSPHGCPGPSTDGAGGSGYADGPPGFLDSLDLVAAACDAVVDILSRA